MPKQNDTPLLQADRRTFQVLAAPIAAVVSVLPTPVLAAPLAPVMPLFGSACVLLVQPSSKRSSPASSRSGIRTLRRSWLQAAGAGSPNKESLLRLRALSDRPDKPGQKSPEVVHLRREGFVEHKAPMSY